MDHKQVLVTGGTDGIGLGLARRFRLAGARVVVTGRDPTKLERARAEGFIALASDIGDPVRREALATGLLEHLPHLDVVVNNAGIQRRVPLAGDEASWAERQRELDILLAGPVHLNALLVPRLLDRTTSLVVNVTSGGAFVPQVFAPLYSACKAALHSYTMTLRHALALTTCRVVELVPPRVQTSLGGADGSGAPLEDFCDTVFPKLFTDDEVGYGPTVALRTASRGDLDAAFASSAVRYPVETYRGKV